jgi:hypothetical protein
MNPMGPAQNGSMKKLTPSQVIYLLPFSPHSILAIYTFSNTSKMLFAPRYDDLLGSVADPHHVDSDSYLSFSFRY